MYCSILCHALLSVVRPDPNFLGKPVKRPAHLDKTGSPYVKMKPTGIVPPSPQGSTPPAITNSAPQATPTLPLRKSDIDHTPKTPPPPVPPPPPKLTSVPLKKPSFLPRVIATPSSSSAMRKKKPLQQTQQVVGRQRESQTSGASDTNEVGVAREGAEDVAMETQPERVNEVFIGPRLPDHTHSTPPTGSLSASPKVAWVQPQVKPAKPAKPVALVHPVTTEGNPKEVVTVLKGLAGKPFSGKAQQSSTPGWRPVGMSSSETPATNPRSLPESARTQGEEVEKASEVSSKPSPLSLATETRKRKKRKKKRSHRTEEEREVQRERKHHGKSGNSTEERVKKRALNYSSEEDSKEEEEQEAGERRERKKRRFQHESHRERRRSRRVRDSRSSSSGSSSRSSSEDEVSDRGAARRRAREDKRERKHSGGHREEGYARHDDAKHRHSSGGRLKYRSPSPERKRKRKWSLGSDESHGSRYKSSKQLESHHAKKRHSSDHHHHHHKHSHHHHERNKSAKHATTKGKSSGIGAGASEGKPGEGKVRSNSRKGTEGGGHHLESSPAVEVVVEGGRVPEVEWDFSLKGEERGQGVPPGGRWDGSRRDDVVDVLTSHTPDQLGTKGNAVCVCLYRCTVCVLLSSVYVCCVCVW